MTLTDEFEPIGPEYQPITEPITVCVSRRELRVQQNQRRAEPEPHLDVRFWVIAGDTEIPTRSGVRLSRDEARLLRDTLNSMDLGDC